MNMINFFYWTTSRGILVISTKKSGMEIPIIGKKNIEKTAEYLKIPKEDLEDEKKVGLPFELQVSVSKWEKFLKNSF